MMSHDRTPTHTAKLQVESLHFLSGALEARKDVVFDEWQMYDIHRHMDLIRGWMGFEHGRPMYQNVERYGRGMAYYMRNMYTKCMYYFGSRLEVSPDPYTDEEIREMEEALEDERIRQLMQDDDDWRDDDPDAYCY